MIPLKLKFYSSMLTEIREENIVNHIYFIRGEKVMLDVDLASLYNVETRVLKQAVRRNIDRFPKGFMFELSNKEIDLVVSQPVIPSTYRLQDIREINNWK